MLAFRAGVRCGWGMFSKSYSYSDRWMCAYIIFRFHKIQMEDFDWCIQIQILLQNKWQCHLFFTLHIHTIVIVVLVSWATHLYIYIHIHDAGPSVEHQHRFMWIDCEILTSASASVWKGLKNKSDHQHYHMCSLIDNLLPTVSVLVQVHMVPIAERIVTATATAIEKVLLEIMKTQQIIKIERKAQ